MSAMQPSKDASKESTYATAGGVLNPGSTSYEGGEAKAGPSQEEVLLRDIATKFKEFNNSVTNYSTRGQFGSHTQRMVSAAANEKNSWTLNDRADQFRKLIAELQPRLNWFGQKNEPVRRAMLSDVNTLSDRIDQLRAAQANEVAKLRDQCSKMAERLEEAEQDAAAARESASARSIIGSDISHAFSRLSTFSRFSAVKGSNAGRAHTLGCLVAEFNSDSAAIVAVVLYAPLLTAKEFAAEAPELEANIKGITEVSTEVRKDPQLKAVLESLLCKLLTEDNQLAAVLEEIAVAAQQNQILSKLHTCIITAMAPDKHLWTAKNTYSISKFKKIGGFLLAEKQSDRFSKDTKLKMKGAMYNLGATVKPAANGKNQAKAGSKGKHKPEDNSADAENTAPIMSV